MPNLKVLNNINEKIHEDYKSFKIKYNMILNEIRKYTGKTNIKLD